MGNVATSRWVTVIRRALVLAAALACAILMISWANRVKAPASASVDVVPRVAGTAHFAAIGDFGNTGQPEADVATMVRGWDPELIITLGDDNYPDGSATTIDTNIGQYYSQYIYPYTGAYSQPTVLVNRFFPALGNHDWNTPNAQPYLDYFRLPGNERYYEYGYGPVRLFSIDSDGHEPDGVISTSVQANWLQSRLAAAQEPWKLVYFHHPPYSSGVAHGMTPYMQWPFQQWGASAVLSGHEHNYERFVLGGFPYIVNGLGGTPNIYGFGEPMPGSMVRYNDDVGAMLIDASDTSITFQFFTRTGLRIDTYTLSVPTPTPSSTSTATSIPTNTPTGTNTPTATSTPTASSTHTATNTSTPTDTPTPTSTSTAIATATATAVQTHTVTSTSTHAAISTNTAAPTTMPTYTNTITSTHTSTSTPPLSATSTAVATNTATTTRTPASTQTATATSTQTTTTAPVVTNTATVATTNTPRATNTTQAVTATPTATYIPTNTTVATPTVCAMSFQDMPDGVTFYGPVLCLACRGIVNGYPCGGPGEPCVSPLNKPYFRPGNPVTRGEIAKIISNSKGFDEPPAGQAFEDVAPGSTFYPYVQRLVVRGLMQGYSCSGPGEPCISPLNRPYFRPNITATRGQMAKFVNFGTPPIEQTFEDVPPGSTFYTYIQALAQNGWVDGYPCGGPGEPCVTPLNRPYFRPGNPVTRGQASKIVSNVFFPQCAAEDEGEERQ